MLQITITKAFNLKLLRQPDRAGHRYYLVRNGETALYVGRSKTPLDRLWQHMGWRGLSMRKVADQSRLGQLIDTNMPESFRWTITLFTQSDCEPLILQHISSERLQKLYSAADQTTLLAITEQALIDEYHPQLNQHTVTYDLNAHQSERYTG
jgi:hypothetical protein